MPPLSRKKSSWGKKGFGVSGGEGGGEVADLGVQVGWPRAEGNGGGNNARPRHGVVLVGWGWRVRRKGGATKGTNLEDAKHAPQRVESAVAG